MCAALSSFLYTIPEFFRLAAVLVKYSGLNVTYIILFVRLSIVSKRFNTNFQKGYRLFR